MGILLWLSSDGTNRNKTYNNGAYKSAHTLTFALSTIEFDLLLVLSKTLHAYNHSLRFFYFNNFRFGRILHGSMTITVLHLLMYSTCACYDDTRVSCIIIIIIFYLYAHTRVSVVLASGGSIFSLLYTYNIFVQRV